MANDLSSAIKTLVDGERLPGVGAIALDKSGKQIYNQAFGHINGPESKEYTNDTQMIFWSCTKFVTCIAALQLLEQGKIASLDDPVSKYLPSQADVEVITGFDAEKKPQTRKAQQEMKVIHLFTHTAGYTYDFWDKLMFEYRQSKGQSPGSYGGLGAEWVFNDAFLEFDPGTQYNYGTNIDFLGFIVEELSGMALPDYVKQHITDPLGMTRTGTQFSDNDWLRCHLKSAEGKLTAVESIENAKEPWKFGGGHYMVSTLNDYSQILLAILNEGKHPGTGNRILKPETVEKCVFGDFIPHVGCSPDPIGKIPDSLVPGLSLAGDMLKGQRKGWSCGLMLNLDDVSGGRRANSGAWAGLGNLYYWIDPKAGKAGIYGTSILPFLDADSLAISDQLESVAYGT